MAALWPSSVAPQETFCQLWPGAPLGQAATWIWAAGHSQLTSPTSVEPGEKASPWYRGSRKSFMAWPAASRRALARSA